MIHPYAIIFTQMLLVENEMILYSCSYSPFIQHAILFIKYLFFCQAMQLYITPMDQRRRRFPWCKNHKIFFSNSPSYISQSFWFYRFGNLQTFQTSWLIIHTLNRVYITSHDCYSLTASKSFDKSKTISVPERKAVSTQRTVELRPQITITIEVIGKALRDTDW